MNIRVIAVGKIKKKYISEGVCDYGRRLSKYSFFEIIEVKDEKTGENEYDGNLSRRKEGERIIPHLSEKSFVVCLDIKGKTLSSEQFSEFIVNKRMERIKELVFVIGGSCGLSEEVLIRADYKLSFSEMTFPHELMRLILLEQLYRAEKIIRGEPYHK